MNSESPRIPLEDLLADATWIRSLAGSLVRDAAAADDIVQETWGAALTNPPRAEQPARPWLRAVVTNAARKLFREEGRRRARERASAGPEGSRLPGPGELAERLETQRMLAGLVAGLKEPFRSTVLLRFWEGLSSAEIARRQGTPAGTVRWRLKRALDELRGCLDRRHDGHRAAWLPLLLPISEPGPVVATAGGGLVAAALVGLGGWFTVKKIVAATALLVLLFLGARISGVISAPPDPAHPNVPREVEAAHALPVNDGTEGDETAPRESGFNEGETAVAAAVPAGTGVVRLRLVDADGRPVEGAQVRPGWRHPVVRSAEDGDVTVRLPMDKAETSIRVEIKAPGFANQTLSVVVRRGETSNIGVLALDPGGVVTGIVVGPDGRPIGAVVRTPDGKPFPGALIEYSTRTETSVRMCSGTFVSEKARFHIRNSHSVVGDFPARDPKGRFGPARVLRHPAGGGEIVLTLTTGTPLIVRVVDETGAVVPEFVVHLVDAATKRRIGSVSGVEGRAETVSPTVPYRVQVCGAGFEHTTVDGGGDDIRVRVRRHSPIEGIVLVDGRPRGGARVRAHYLFYPGRIVTCCDFPVWLNPRPVGETVSADDGTFRLRVSAKGKILVRVDVDWFAPAESRPIVFDPLEGLTGLKFEPRPGGSIAGKVVPAAGVDPAGTVVAISRGDGYARTARAGADGAFRFDHLAPGRWRVVVREKEIPPGSIGTATSYGKAPPIPYDCEVREGETTTHDLIGRGGRASIAGRLLIDGRAPKAWTAALYPAGGAFLSKTKAGVTFEGMFRLQADSGDYRLVLSAPGRAFEGMVVTADLTLVGDMRWECLLSTGTIDVSHPKGSVVKETLFHRISGGNGALVLTPLPSGDGKTRVPAGAGEIVRFEVRHWLRPDRWPVVAKIDVPPAGVMKITLAE
jgi:RNA polymerase sigma factor (sigma-70 family)